MIYTGQRIRCGRCLCERQQLEPRNGWDWVCKDSEMCTFRADDLRSWCHPECEKSYWS